MSKKYVLLSVFKKNKNNNNNINSIKTFIATNTFHHMDVLFVVLVYKNVCCFETQIFKSDGNLFDEPDKIF